MGQLARRLAELATAHAGGPRAWQPTIDRVADYEKQGDQKRAHALFTASRETLEKAHLRDLVDALAEFEWLVDVPFADPDVVTAQERARFLRAFPRALAHARAIAASLAEAQRVAATLEARALEEGALTVFERVPFADVARAAEDAEALRRRVTAEARVQERAADAVKRARKLKARRVSVPDTSVSAVPDAQDAHRLLDAAEAALADAERVEAAAASVRRELKDASIGEYRSQSLRALKRRVHAAERDEDARAALATLERLLAEARALRKDAAALATTAARARKSGRRGPARESRSASDDPAYL